MVEDYFEDVNVFLVSFKQNEKLFKRTIVVPFVWNDKKIKRYLQESFQEVTVIRVTLVDSAWMPIL